MVESHDLAILVQYDQETGHGIEKCVHHRAAADMLDLLFENPDIGLGGPGKVGHSYTALSLLNPGLSLKS